MIYAVTIASFRYSPTFDEPAHFASGVILATSNDPGYFKVNPPANKWVTACSSLVAPALEIPALAASSSFANTMRPEFEVGDKLLELNRDKSYFRALVIARLARLPFLLFESGKRGQPSNSFGATVIFAIQR